MKIKSDLTKHSNLIKKVIFVIGLPGVGKSSLCKDLENKYDNYLHLSTGNVLRKIVSDKKEPNWKVLEMKMNSGEYVQSSDVMYFLKETVISTTKEYIVLDGFPRTKDNIDSWNATMSSIAQVVAVLYFHCDDSTMINRVMNRNNKRNDDSLENINRRKEMFNKETFPLLEIFKNECKPILDINTEKDEQTVFSYMETELKKYYFL